MAAEIDKQYVHLHLWFCILIVCKVFLFSTLAEPQPFRIGHVDSLQ
jgi:hypothetical protein